MSAGISSLSAQANCMVKDAVRIPDLALHHTPHVYVVQGRPRRALGGASLVLGTCQSYESDGAKILAFCRSVWPSLARR